MDKVVKELISILAKGDANSLAALLLAIICALGWYCFRLMKQLEKKDERIYKIIDDYSKNNITITEALNNLRAVLIEIKSRL